ncbi:MAG: efflux RND transporter periplasmic adaptor subunit [Clostridiales bacterium]|jgi:HlyD family secretion protein|nr:efflux RND transporter periplasmic adaptor subunit [Clostridiales bacterium]
MKEERARKFRSIFERIKKVASAVMRIMFLTLLAAAAALAAAYWYYNANKPPDLAALHPTVEAVYSTISKQVLATGHVRAKDSATVFLDATEKISKIHVKEGDIVEEGQPLIDYDVAAEVEDLERKLFDAQTNLENAEYNLELITLPIEGNELLQYTSEVVSAEKNLYDAQAEGRSLDVRLRQQQAKIDDAKRLMDNNQIQYDGGILPKNEYDTSVSAYESAFRTMEDLLLQQEANYQTISTRQVQLEDAQRKLANAENRMNDQANVIKLEQQKKAIELIQSQKAQIQSDLGKLKSRSYSPISGYILSISVKEGELAAKGAILMEIADISTVQVYAEVSEYDAPQLEADQVAEITTAGLPDQVFNGVISKIAYGAVEKEKSSGDEVVVPVEFDITNINDSLKIGYSVDIAVTTDSKSGVLAIPIQTVLIEGFEKHVYLMKDGQLEKVSVKTGFYGDRAVEIASGISEHDQVVANPAEVSEDSGGFMRSEALYGFAEGLLRLVAPIADRYNLPLELPSP